MFERPPPQILPTMRSNISPKTLPRRTLLYRHVNTRWLQNRPLRVANKYWNRRMIRRMMLLHMGCCFTNLGCRRNAFIIQSGIKMNCSGERASSMLHATLDSCGISVLPVNACRGKASSRNEQTNQRPENSVSPACKIIALLGPEFAKKKYAGVTGRRVVEG